MAFQREGPCQRGTPSHTKSYVEVVRLIISAHKAEEGKYSACCVQLPSCHFLQLCMVEVTRNVAPRWLEIVIHQRQQLKLNYKYIVKSLKVLDLLTILGLMILTKKVIQEEKT